MSIASPSLILYQCAFDMIIMINRLFVLLVCLFVWGFSAHSRIFHLFGDVNIADKGLHIFDQYSALIAIKQRVYFNVPHLL